MRPWFVIAWLTLGLAGCNQQQAPQHIVQQDAGAADQTRPVVADATALPASATRSSEPTMTKDLSPGADAQPGHQDALKQRFAEIKTMIGEAKASDVQQCRKVAFGYKACGGPASYLIYSLQGLDEQVLLQKVSEYNALAKSEAQRLGLMSDCSMVLEPSVVLVDGVCKAGPAGDFLLR